MLVRICNRTKCDNECVKDTGFCYNCCIFRKYSPMKTEQIYEYINEKDEYIQDVPYFDFGNYQSEKEWLNTKVYRMMYKKTVLPSIEENDF